MPIPAMCWRGPLPCSNGRSTSARPAILPECRGCKETLPEIRSLLAPTDSQPCRQYRGPLSRIWKPQNGTGSASCSAPTRAAEPPQAAFELGVDPHFAVTYGEMEHSSLPTDTVLDGP